MIGIGIVSLLLIGAAAILWWRPAVSPSAPETRFDIRTAAAPTSMALSPDGATVVFAAEARGQSGLWLRSMGSDAGRFLAGTEGAGRPFWSPDGGSLGFFADGRLKRLDLASGTIQTLGSAPNPQGGAWSPDGTIYFTPTQIGPIMRVSSGGGEASPVTELTPGQVGHLFPQLLADNAHLLFFAGGGPDLRGV